MVLTNADMPHGKMLLNWYFGVEPGITLRGFNLIALLVGVELFIKALGSTISLRLCALWRYYQQGARFAKWRAVIKVDSTIHPSSTAILENAHGLARYAQICQVFHIHGSRPKTILWQCKHAPKTYRTWKVLYAKQLVPNPNYGQIKGSL